MKTLFQMIHNADESVKDALDAIEGAVAESPGEEAKFYLSSAHGLLLRARERLRRAWQKAGGPQGKEGGDA
jgi:hypothetical protein